MTSTPAHSAGSGTFVVARDLHDCVRASAQRAPFCVGPFVCASSSVKVDD